MSALPTKIKMIPNPFKNKSISISHPNRPTPPTHYLNLQLVNSGRGKLEPRDDQHDAGRPVDGHELRLLVQRQVPELL
jgi:hypothetical protein